MFFKPNKKSSSGLYDYMEYGEAKASLIVLGIMTLALSVIGAGVVLI